MTTTARVPVLIVGGGPVGLALAGDLGRRGIRTLLVEQSDGSIYQPRQDFLGVRTMEFCRRWGLVEAVEATPYPRDYEQDCVYLTAMNGYELGRHRFPALDHEVPPRQSPQHRERCPQNMFDPVLRAFAEAQPSVTLRHRTRLIGFTQDAAGARAEIEDLVTGAREQIEADYLAGCDGANSLVRKTLGIAMTGNPALTYTTNVIFRCPHLLTLHDKGKAYRHIFIDENGTWATLVAINGRDQWRFSIVGGREPRERSEAEIHAAIRRAVGVDFDYELLSTVHWVRRELVADAMRDRRAFILGDAAHAMSPTGGFGLNTGLQDVVDLSWKLTAMLQGWGGPALLDSYDRERRPVGARNVAEASRNLRRMTSVGSNPALLDDGPDGVRARRQVGSAFIEAMSNEWFTLGVHLGYRYEGSPILWPDGTPEPPDDLRNYVQTARPGHRAPHAWLADGRSTLDLFGDGFTLLGFAADAAEIAGVIEAARERGVPLAFHRIDQADVAAIYERKFVLVRPDGHVAWRDDRPPADALALIDHVRGAGAPAEQSREPALTAQT
jgi:2-polyprenyl-6-methoxyphenol hydroxylase-like FAD-dependent oxidoreductase